MLEFFGAVPEYVLLDNSTSLVTKADLFEPQFCADFKGMAAYYDFAPMAARPGRRRSRGNSAEAPYRCVAYFSVPES